MFEIIPEWAQNQASQREQQNPTMMGGGSNLAGILGGQAPQDTGGMMGAIGAQPPPQEAYGNGPNSLVNQGIANYRAARAPGQPTPAGGFLSPEQSIQAAQTAYQGSRLGQLWDANTGSLRYDKSGALIQNPYANDPVAARAQLGLGPDGMPMGAGGGAQSGGTNLASILGQQQPSSGMMGTLSGGGVDAALGTQLQGHYGSNLSGAASGAATGAMFGPWGAAIGGALGGLAHQFSKTNNTALQDIHQALAAGLPVSDASWAKAGYGPGGSGGPAGGSAIAGRVVPISGRPNQISIG